MAYSDETLALCADFWNYDTREKVGVIVRDRDGKLLVVEGKTHKLSLPKGGRFLGETEYEGALRECWEETGLDLWRHEPVKKIKLIWGTYWLFRLPMRGEELTLVAQESQTLKVLWKDPGSYWMKKVAVMNCDLGHYVLSCKKKFV